MTWLFQVLLPGAAQQQAAGGNHALVADAGAFGLNGQAATPLRTGRLNASTGTAALNGQPAGIASHRRLVVEAGATALSGQDVAFGDALSASEGLFALGGQPAAPRISRRVAAQRGAFGVTAFAANLGSAGQQQPAFRPAALALSLSI